MPAERSSFVGRENEIADIAVAVASSFGVGLGGDFDAALADAIEGLG